MVERSSVPSRQAEQFVVRMPDGMRTWIAEEARRNLRSANAQIVWMLQQMMEREKARAA